jgi:hypothetical protein
VGFLFDICLFTFLLRHTLWKIQEYNKNYLLLSFILRIIIEIMLMIAATAVGSIAAVVVSGGGSNSFIYFIYSSA